MLYDHRKDLNEDSEFVQKYGVFFEGMKPKVPAIYNQCFVMIRLWLSSCFLVYTFNYPSIQIIGLALINFISLRLSYEVMPCSEFIENIDRIMCDTLVLLATLFFAGLLTYRGETLMYQFIVNSVFSFFIAALSIPAICYMIQLAKCLYEKYVAKPETKEIKEVKEVGAKKEKDIPNNLKDTKEVIISKKANTQLV